MAFLRPIPQPFLYRGDSVAGGGEDITSRLAPPYDMVDAATRKALAESDEANVVSLDVPHFPPREAGPSARYQMARDRFEMMRASGILGAINDSVLGIARHSFRTRRGEWYRRFSLIADIPIDCETDAGCPGIFRHEESDPGVVRDRLSLYRSSRVMAAPIVGLFPDSSGSIEDRMRKHTLSGPPRRVGVTPDGTLHELWIVSDSNEIAGFIDAFADRAITIADGHNRYAAALTYLESLPDDLDPNHPARRTTMALTSLEDPGMAFGPVHRVISGMAQYAIDRLVVAAEGALLIASVACDIVDLPAKVREARYKGSHAMGLYDFETDMCFIAMSEDVDPLAATFPDAPSTWRRLDPVVCEHLLIREILCEQFNAGQPVHRRNTPRVDSIPTLIDQVPPPQLAIIMEPIDLADVMAASTSGHLLPAASTFFWPKFPSGLLLSLVE